MEAQCKQIGMDINFTSSLLIASTGYESFSKPWENPFAEGSTRNPMLFVFHRALALSAIVRKACAKPSETLPTAPVFFGSQLRGDHCLGLVSELGAEVNRGDWREEGTGGSGVMEEETVTGDV